MNNLPDVSVQDEDGHWYLIPKHRIEDFYRYLYDEDNTGLECWERRGWSEFESYMTGGGPIYE